MPHEWRPFCLSSSERFDHLPHIAIGKLKINHSTSVYETIKTSNVTHIYCNLNNSSDEIQLDFKTFRQFALLKNDSLFAITIKSSAGANISLPWPMRAHNLVYLYVQGCGIHGFNSEIFDKTINNIPDSLLYHFLTDVTIYLNLETEVERNMRMSEITKAGKCGPENVFVSINRNVTFNIILPLDKDVQKIVQPLMMANREYQRDLSRVEITCNYSNMEVLDRSINTALERQFVINLLQNSVFPNLRVFNLSFVKLNTISDKLGSWRLYFPNIDYLDLSHNAIDDVSEVRDFEIPDERHGHGTLDVTYNNISKLTMKTLKTFKQHHSFVVDVRNNPFDCNCDMKDFLEFFNDAKLSSELGIQYNYLKNLQCTSPEYLKGRRILDLTAIDLGCFIETETIMTAPIVILCLFITLLFVILVISVKYRREILILAFTRLHILLPCQSGNEPENGGKMYDAFVAYSEKDADWVMKVMTTSLEQPHQGPAFKLCLHHRDFKVGAAIAENIIESVETSRHTILILSKHFLESEWCLMEFRTAFHQSLIEKKKHLIMVNLENKTFDENLDQDLKRCMKTLTYVNANDRLFFDKIVFALSDKQKKYKLFKENLQNENLRTHFTNNNEK